MNHIPPELLEHFSNDQLEGIASGKLIVNLIEFKGDGLMRLRASRDAKREAGESTVRMDAQIELAERMTRGPIFHFTEVEKAA